MNGHLFLGGGGEIEDSFELDALFFRSLQPNNRLLYIPIALNRTREQFKTSCLNWFESLVAKHIRNASGTIDMLLEDSSIPNLLDFDGIYIGGGNTYKLLQYVFDNNLDSTFRKYIKSGGRIYGGSAGAMIFGKDIRTVAEEKESYTRHEALNWLGGYSVFCHYDITQESKVRSISTELNSPIYAIGEDGGVVFGKNMELLENVGTVFAFENGANERL